MKWFPNRKGTAMGFVVGGFGGGAMVFNQIQTAIVNFENYKVIRIVEYKKNVTDLLEFFRLTKIFEFLICQKCKYHSIFTAHQKGYST